MQEIYRGAWVVAYRELLRFVQERSRIVSSLGMPLLFLLIFGGGLTRVVGPLAEGVDFVQFMYPGVLAMGVLTTSLFSGLSVVWDREFGFLKELLVAPLSRTGIVLGKAIGAGSVALLQAMITLALAPLLGLRLSPGLIVSLLPLLLLLSLSLSSLGILIASWMRSQQGYQVIMQLIIFPMIFLSGAFFPVSQMPLWMEAIARLNPLSYGVDAIRQLFLGPRVMAPMAGTSGMSLGVTLFGRTATVFEEAFLIAALGSVLMAMAIYSFSRQE